MNNGSSEKIDKTHDTESSDFALKLSNKKPQYTIPKIPLGLMNSKDQFIKVEESSMRPN